MSGPILRNYKNGSIVYFEKDKAEDIYVLHAGRVILTSKNLHGTEVKEDVRLGEFFGVKSALGKYPREETAQVAGTATLLVFKVPEFEKFVSNKTHLILKMLKVFSSQLRAVHRQVRELLGEAEAKNPSFEIVNLAEVFHRNGDYDHALYAYKKYEEMYPGGVYSERVQELVVLAENQSPFPISLPTLEYKPEARGAGPSFGGGGGASAKPTASLDHLFEKGKELFDNGSMSEALAIFKNLSQNYSANGEDDELIIANASFFAGKCFYKSGANDPAGKSLMKYVESQPQGEYAKEAYLILGNLARDAGDTERAGSLYYQVIELGGDDEFVQEATSQKGALE